MSIKPYTEKIKKKKFEFVRVGSGSRTGPGSIIPEADPRIRIRLKMIRIRNTEKYRIIFNLNFVFLPKGIKRAKLAL